METWLYLLEKILFNVSTELVEYDTEPYKNLTSYKFYHLWNNIKIAAHWIFCMILPIPLYCLSIQKHGLNLFVQILWACFFFSLL